MSKSKTRRVTHFSRKKTRRNASVSSQVTAMEAAFKKAFITSMQAEQISKTEIASPPCAVSQSTVSRRRLTAIPPAGTRAERLVARQSILSKATPSDQRPACVSRPNSCSDNREQRLKRRLAGLADAYEAQMLSSAAGCMPSLAERRRLKQRVRRGRLCASCNDGGAQQDVILGIDFGSTSTKVVARLPFVAGRPAAAMPVPESARAEGNPYLWSTRIWSHKDGRLNLFPFKDACQRSALKTRLLADPTDLDQVQAAFFLAQIICYARDWAVEKLGPIAGGQTFRWNYNFGFPADSLDEPILLDMYRRVIAASLILSMTERAPTIAGSAAVLSEVKHRPLNILEDHSATIQPEVVGAVAAALEYTNLSRDLFMMVDIGGVTVDCCTFKYIPNEDGDARMPIYKAKVESLGAECEIACRDDAQLMADLRESVLTQMRSVIWDTYRDYMRNDECWGRGLPILMVGGGAKHSFYRDLKDEIHRWLVEYFHQKRCPGVQSGSSSPSFPTLVKEFPIEDEHRLSVATGLSNPDYELPEIRLSHEIEALKSREATDYSGRFIGAEMT